MFRRYVLALHKWLGLLVGAQVLMWMLSGLYMTALPIEFIRGTHLFPDVSNHQRPIAELEPWLTEQSIYGDLNISSVSRGELDLWKISTRDQTIYLSAVDLSVIQALDASSVSFIASELIEDKEVASVRLVEPGDPIREINPKLLPAWQVTFDDWATTTLYLNPYTGEVVTARTDYWRWFDIFWMLHIMDYQERSNFNNPLVIFMVSLALFLTLSGIIITVNRLSKGGLRWLRV